jgi:hypothetical protein
MIHNEADNIEKSILETLKAANTQDQITKEKSSTREQVIAKLAALLAISFKRGTATRSRGGLKAQQKWFSISASLAQTLARLVSDLEYENLRIEYEELKKMVLEGNVTSQGIALPQTGLREPKEGNSEQQT